MSASDLAIRVSGLSKAYTIRHQQQPAESTLAETLLGRLRRPFSRCSATETFWALKDIDFEVRRGDVVGIIGRNGAGKSTLLKILSRITEPTAGRIELFGRVGALLEVGTGFHPELTGRENVFLNGNILGMTRAEIRRQFDAIVDFAGVERFLDTPVKRYSSGMYVRLAFAVAAHLQSEILVVDEVLAVGDIEFQKKCLGKMQDVADHGRTVLFVSHNTAATRALCSRAILLRHGELQAHGTVADVLDNYVSEAIGQRSQTYAATPRRTSTGSIHCRHIAIRSGDGGKLVDIVSGRAFEIVVHYDARTAMKGVTASIDIDAMDGSRITTLYSGFHNQHFDVTEGEGRLVCKVASLPLLPGDYRVNVMLGQHHSQCDFVQDIATVRVVDPECQFIGEQPRPAHGYTQCRYAWSVLSSST